MKISDITEARTLQSNLTPIEELLEAYLFFSSLGTIHLDQGATSPEGREEIKKVLQRLTSDHKKLSNLSKPQIEKNKDNLLRHIHSMLTYMQPVFKKHLEPRAFENKKAQITKLADLYKNAATTNESYSPPQFDVEWEEAKRYPFLADLGQTGWQELAKTGKAVMVDKNSVKRIGNTGADGSETFDDLEPDKVERFYQAQKTGTIEMPIVIKMPDGKLELVAGNTRLIGLISTTGKAKVWYIDASKLVATEGNKAQLGIPANATDAELRKARKAGGKKGQRAHWLLNMRKGNRKK